MNPCCYLAGAIRGLSFVEWDHATVPGFDTWRYLVVAGRVGIPELPGFGIELDPERFQYAMTRTGFARKL